jgi:hypothetical protein
MFRRHKNTLILPLLAAVLLAGVVEYKVTKNIQRKVASDAAADPASGAELSVSNDPGSNRPSEGRSYFDLVFSKRTGNGYSYDIPFPLEKLTEKLSSYSGLSLNSTDRPGLVGAIFPMGRSLQRNAAVQGLTNIQNNVPYFQFPRVVLGIDGETAAPLKLNLKNKLFTGYNEKAEILEVISYNENLGRYEYQIVNDYAYGKIPKVRYANRPVCLSCHQNQAPIFSKAPWSESNANPAVARELSNVLKSNQYHGFSTEIDQIITNRFDTATDQANLLIAYQKIWRDLCSDPDCRRNVFKYILLYRLTGRANNGLPDEFSAWSKSFEQNWQVRWPKGLAVLSADIPNRDPFKDISTAGEQLSSGAISGVNLKTVSDLLSASRIPAEFEPLVQRKPGEIWTDSASERIIRGLGKEFTQSDISLFDRWLSRNTSHPAVTLNSKCRIEEIEGGRSVECRSADSNGFNFSVFYKANSIETSVNAFSFNASNLKENSSTVLAKIEQKNSKIIFYLKTFPEKYSLRSAGGFLVSPISVDIGTGEARLSLYNQENEINLLAEQAMPSLVKGAFSRVNIMNVLAGRLDPALAASEDLRREGLPLTVDSENFSDDPADSTPGFALIKNNCRECHQNSEGAPPNFLGAPSDNLSDKELCRRIEVCVPRMLYRLKMRRCQPDDLAGKKNPMPPDFFLNSHKISKDSWMSKFNPKIILFLNQLTNESELARDIEASGMTQSEATRLAKDVLSDECPASSSILYEHLPKCQFDDLKAESRCK